MEPSIHILDVNDVIKVFISNQVNQMFYKIKNTNKIQEANTATKIKLSLVSSMRVQCGQTVREKNTSTFVQTVTTNIFSIRTELQ